MVAIRPEAGSLLAVAKSLHNWPEVEYSDPSIRQTDTDIDLLTAYKPGHVGSELVA